MTNENGYHTHRTQDDPGALSHPNGPRQRAPESLPAYGAAAIENRIMRDLKACAYLCGANMLMDDDGIPYGWRMAE